MVPLLAPEALLVSTPLPAERMSPTDILRLLTSFSEWLELHNLTRHTGLSTTLWRRMVISNTPGVLNEIFGSKSSGVSGKSLCSLPRARQDIRRVEYLNGVYWSKAPHHTRLSTARLNNH